MSKVITFSRVFPSYHPRKGEPTYFVEKLCKGFPDFNADQYIPLKSDPKKDIFSLIELAIDIWMELAPKYHTIRSGNRWKVGDKFCPRVWQGKPYTSKMITIAPDIEIKKIIDVLIEDGVMYVHNGKNLMNPCDMKIVEEIAKNDGLSFSDLYQWFNGFKKPFKGQIICWNDKIEY